MVHMSDKDGTDKQKRRFVCLVLYLSIAIASIIYTKIGNAEGAHAEPERTNGSSQDESVLNIEKDKSLDGLRDDEPLKNIIPVPFLNQNNYPTGCESVTAVMALQYAGIDISVDDFIDHYLRIGTYYEKDGQYYGNSPYYYFIGDPRTGSGFGCFAPVIHDALSEAAGLDRVKDLTGMPLEEIAGRYIARDIPVIVWATIDMQPTYEGGGWTILETGKYYTWPAEEHCLLLVGVDEEYYYFNDPEKETGMVRYEKAVTENRYAKMGSQALAVLPPGR